MHKLFIVRVAWLVQTQLNGLINNIFTGYVKTLWFLFIPKQKAFGEILKLLHQFCEKGYMVSLVSTISSIVSVSM